MVSKDETDKIDVDDLIKDFKVLQIDPFQRYLREVWKDLVQRSEDKTKGVNKITFSKYYELPGIISDRLFAVLDKNNDNYLDHNEFSQGMCSLFSGTDEENEKFIFNLYDFDRDGKITKEDCKVVMSYIPLNIKQSASEKLTFEKEEYKDRIESQDELDRFLDKSFQGLPSMDYKTFLKTVEKVSSDFYLFTLIYLLKKRPFTNSAIEIFSNKKSSNFSNTPPTLASKVSPTVEKRMIVSPTLNSKFSPSTIISNSPSIKRRSIMQEGDKNIMSKLELGKGNESKNALMKYAVNTKEKKTEIEQNKNENEKAPVRKARNLLKNIEDVPQKNLHIAKDYDDSDMQFTPARKQDLIQGEGEGNISDDEEEIKHEGFLYKVTNSKKLKKLWFRLIGKEIYYYKSQEEKVHKGMHNLSGVFIQEELPTKIENQNFFCFSVIYPKKNRVYYVENKEDYENWLKQLRKAIGYSSLTSIYDVQEKLGNGKFGLVKLGIHRKSGRKVAIKIMKKKDMTVQDLELVKTEIEILKIGQHPNIIRLYDIFENVDYIYIIMEHCAGGDLFSYIEKRGFRLPEPRAAELIHKLSTAIFYLHNFGIVHRDLKPENILMTDSSESADIRLLDFGLSKIIGPNETCNEPYGTLSYVAPEILTEKPYGKSVDLWSIGIITYLLLVGYLPFDDERSEREIARQTIHEPVSWRSSVWKKNSPESKMFVDNLLSKDPSKRMNIKEVLEHPWIQKFSKTDRRKSQLPTFENYTKIEKTEDSNKTKK